MDIPKRLYPFDSHFLSYGGHRYHYLDEGQGSPVVMVHGNPTWSFYYRELVKTLRPTHRCIVPDHIGCGFSDTPDDDHYDYRLSQRVADLTRLIDHLELERDITLVVHDWGGMIGMAWAVEHADRIARLVVLNTSAFPKPATKHMPASLWFVRNTFMGSLLVRGFNAFSWGATHMAVTKSLSPEISRAYRAPYDNWANRIATLRFVQDIPLKSGDPSWDTVVTTEKKLHRLADKPTLICWGDKDFVFDGHFLAQFEQHWPHADVRHFPNGGHYVLEDEGPAICHAVKEFVRPDS